MLNVVLFEPEIPPNTGNIARLCGATNTKLYLKHPLGFSLDNKYLKRAGLDYWNFIDIEEINSLKILWNKFPKASFYYLSTKSKNIYTNTSFKNGDFLVFGPESRGLPEELIMGNSNALNIPMKNNHIRSLNLANSVSIVLFEALRQLKFL